LRTGFHRVPLCGYRSGCRAASRCRLAVCTRRPTTQPRDGRTTLRTAFHRVPLCGYRVGCRAASRCRLAVCTRWPTTQPRGSRSTWRTAFHRVPLCGYRVGGRATRRCRLAVCTRWRCRTALRWPIDVAGRFSQSTTLWLQGWMPRSVVGADWQSAHGGQPHSPAVAERRGEPHSAEYHSAATSGWFGDASVRTARPPIRGRCRRRRRRCRRVSCPTSTSSGPRRWLGSTCRSGAATAGGR